MQSEHFINDFERRFLTHISYCLICTEGITINEESYTYPTTILEFKSKDQKSQHHRKWKLGFVVVQLRKVFSCSAL